MRAAVCTGLGLATSAAREDGAADGAGVSAAGEHAPNRNIIESTEVAAPAFNNPFGVKPACDIAAHGNCGLLRSIPVSWLLRKA
jgi:hypothetical protein